MSQTASSGVASAAGGGGLNILGSLGGVGGVLSGLSRLFGGISTPPPLVEFELPDSHQQTVYVRANGHAVYDGVAVEAQSVSKDTAGIYATGAPTPAQPASPAQNVQYQSMQIAQAVKQALLNSSSLNDVIAEI